MKLSHILLSLLVVSVVVSVFFPHLLIATVSLAILFGIEQVFEHIHTKFHNDSIEQLQELNSTLHERLKIMEEDIKSVKTKINLTSFGQK